MSKYRLEWQYGKGKTHWTYANSEETAINKAEPLINDKTVVCVSLHRIAETKILKDPIEYMRENNLITEEEYNNANSK